MEVITIPNVQGQSSNILMAQVKSGEKKESIGFMVWLELCERVLETGNESSIIYKDTEWRRGNIAETLFPAVDAEEPNYRPL